MAIDRRSFLRGTAVATSALPLALLFRRRANATTFGPLIPDPSGILDLPAGFSYTVVDRAFDDMSDGYRVPAKPDGMACFAGPDGAYVLMRNHEVSRGDTANGPYKPGQTAPPQAYDPAGMGGVTRLVLDSTTLERISSNLVLAGTVRNCCGGPSPWGWLSCEETTSPGHGYVFLCPPDAERVSEPRRITGYGRFNHEAVAIDPVTRIAYLTEDRGDGALYRFVPTDRDTPFVGTLETLVAHDALNFDTANAMNVGDSIAIEWTTIDDPDPTDDTVRHEASNKGAARISRGEGIWYANGSIYVCSTNGGPGSNGQIFILDIEQQSLMLLAQSADDTVLDNPDNIIVAPWGDLFLAEDGGGEQYVRILGSTGEISSFARNALSTSEFAGVCFSPDGQTMFVNLQHDGLTLAIIGDFPDVTPPGSSSIEIDPLGPEPGIYTGQWDSTLEEQGHGCTATDSQGLATIPLMLTAATKLKL